MSRYDECVICRKTRRTTNKEKPYVCEPCLRTKGRKILLFVKWFW